MGHAMNPAEVTFYSDGLKIAGYLYSPDDWKPGDAPRPVTTAVVRGDVEQAALEAARIAEQLYEIRYNAGAVALRTYLDAQEQRRAAERAELTSRLALLLAQASLFQVLGGA